MLISDYLSSNKIICILFVIFQFQFLVQMKTSKFAFEIIWPLSFPQFWPWDRGIHKIGLASLVKSRCATVGFPNKSFASYVQHKSRKVLGLFCISSYLEQCSSDQNTLVSCLTERIDERHMSLQLGQKDKSTGLTQ